MDPLVFPSVEGSACDLQYCNLCWDLISNENPKDDFFSQKQEEVSSILIIILNRVLPKEDAKVMSGFLKKTSYCVLCQNSIKAIHEKKKIIERLIGEIESISNQVGIRIARNARIQLDSKDSNIGTQMTLRELQRQKTLRSQIAAKFPKRNSDCCVQEYSNIENDNNQTFTPAASYVPPIVSERGDQEIQIIVTHEGIDEPSYWTLTAVNQDQQFASDEAHGYPDGLNNIESEWCKEKAEIEKNQVEQQNLNSPRSQSNALDASQQHGQRNELSTDILPENPTLKLAHKSEDRNLKINTHCNADHELHSKVDNGENDEDESNEEEEEEYITEDETSDQEGLSKLDVSNKKALSEVKITSASESKLVTTTIKSAPSTNGIGTLVAQNQGNTLCLGGRRIKSVLPARHERPLQKPAKKSKNNKVYTTTSQGTESRKNEIKLRVGAKRSNSNKVPTKPKRRYKARCSRFQGIYKCPEVGCQFQHHFLDFENSREDLQKVANHDLTVHKYPNEPSYFTTEHILHKIDEKGVGFFECPECSERFYYQHLIVQRNKSKGLKIHYGEHVIARRN